MAHKFSLHTYCFYLLSLLNRKGYISAQDLKCVFSLLGETVSDEEIQSKLSCDHCVNCYDVYEIMPNWGDTYNFVAFLPVM